MIDGLPRTSAFGEALALDVDLAREIPEAQGSRAATPPLREWSQEVDLLAAIYDRLADVVQVQYEKPYKSKPYPRPETARDVLRREESRRRRARVRELFRPGEEVS